jgi:hypothetical protein
MPTKAHLGRPARRVAVSRLPARPTSTTTIGANTRPRTSGPAASTRGVASPAVAPPVLTGGGAAVPRTGGLSPGDFSTDRTDFASANPWQPARGIESRFA